ncbi:unnamed protein product [Sphenostylis stenocarpa]|uniref:Uncharacterized protein n=1 Tax=Sphenostylis stenocarpa TaxID=92480 RepID=A0AA86SG15_9FABA|nr:unnamed protein product [Sphenostylis stenocarpa]
MGYGGCESWEMEYSREEIFLQEECGDIDVSGNHVKSEGGSKVGFDILFALYHPNLDAKLTSFYDADKTWFRNLHIPSIFKAQINVYGPVALKAFYLPWAMLALDVIYGSPLIPDLLGIRTYVLILDSVASIRRWKEHFEDSNVGT